MYWPIDDQNSAWDHRNIKLYYSHFGYDIFMIAWQWINGILYYFVDQSKSSLIVRWLFKTETFLAYIEYFVDRCGQLIVGDLENNGQATGEHVGRFFEVS